MHAGEAGGRIAHRVRDDDFASVQQAAAGINNIRDVTFALRFIRTQQRFAQTFDDAHWVVQVEQERAEAIPPHCADAVAQHQPARFGFNRRIAVAQLEKFPRLCER
jgi:hypothetical protein